MFNVTLLGILGNALGQSLQKCRFTELVHEGLKICEKKSPQTCDSGTALNLNRRCGERTINGESISEEMGIGPWFEAQGRSISVGICKLGMRKYQSICKLKYL